MSTKELARSDMLPSSTHSPPNPSNMQYPLMCTGLAAYQAHAQHPLLFTGFAAHQAHAQAQKALQASNPTELNRYIKAPTLPDTVPSPTQPSPTQPRNVSRRQIPGHLHSLNSACGCLHGQPTHRVAPTCSEPTRSGNDRFAGATTP